MDRESESGGLSEGAHMSRRDAERGWTLLDGVSLVLGSAIASIHVLRVPRDPLAAPGWVMVWLAFALVAVTAAGPFVFLARRFAGRRPGYPRIGDQLWGILGIPWLATALLKSATPTTDPRQSPLFVSTLTVGVGLACLVSVVVVWGTWVAVSPERAAQVEAGPWTSRVGLVLSIAWPIQCGLAMIVLS